MASSPPLSLSWCPLPLCPTPATSDSPSSRLPQLRRPHRRGEEQRRLQPFTPPRSDPLRPILITRPGPRVPLHARAPCALGLPLIPSFRFRSNGPDRGYRFAHARPDSLARLSAPKPSCAGPAQSARSPPLSLTLPGPPVSARRPRVPSAADLISAVGFKFDG
jgi:hypothetical protein